MEVVEKLPQLPNDKNSKKEKSKGTETTRAREQAGKLFNVSGRTVGAFEAVRG